jgi:hypothetical protein
LALQHVQIPFPESKKTDEGIPFFAGMKAFHPAPNVRMADILKGHGCRLGGGNE